MCKEIKAFYEKIKRLLKPILYFALAFGVFLALEKHISNLLFYIEEHLIRNISELGLNIITPILFILILFSYWKRRGEKVSQITIFYNLLFISIYVYYRFCSDHFTFWKPFWGIAYTDIVFLPLIAFIVLKKQEPFTEEETKEDNSFSNIIPDNPIEDLKEDELDFSVLVDTIFNRIKGLSPSNKAHSFGVVAPWGGGKTSFLNLLRSKLKEEEDIIIVSFNPRSSKKVNNIQEDFFLCFSEEIAKYHLGFNFIMNRYIRALGLQEHNALLKGVASRVELVFPFNEKNSVNDAIKSIGKRICVVIDDLDRLTGDEILEVFKLIDLNGDFNNTVFLSAYDKKYVNDVLKNHLGYQAYNYYTDKYFSYEITLTESLYDKFKEKKYI